MLVFPSQMTFVKVLKRACLLCLLMDYGKKVSGEWLTHNNPPQRGPLSFKWKNLGRLESQ